MQFLIKYIEQINSQINSFVWGPIMIMLLLFTGIYFSFLTNFLQFKKCKFILEKTLLTIFKKSSNKKSISPFQAMTTALAGTVGTGNIIGCATAIAVGGPGSLFWIIFSALFGMMTKYAEILLAIKYRITRSDGTKTGGPMYYIENGLNLRWFAVIFSIFGFFASFGIGNIAQINSISSVMHSSFKIKPIITGMIIAFLISLIILGDSKRIAKTTEKIVPFMAVFYILMSVIVLIINYKNLIPSIKLVFTCAFKPTAAFGGFVGSNLILTAKKGMTTGIFSNEAGLGSTPIAHSMADVSHPVNQAIWGVFEVFIDTLIVCSLTGLVIISSGMWSSGLIGSELALRAFSTGLGNFALYALSISILFFAFSSIISWSYYGQVCLEYIAKTDKFNTIYKLLFICVIIVGAVSKLTLVWDISETLNGLMAIPNLIAILGLSKVVYTTTKDYFNKFY